MIEIQSINFIDNKHRGSEIEVFMWKKLLDFVYQDLEKILQLHEVTSVTVKYLELDNITYF